VHLQHRSLPLRPIRPDSTQQPRPRLSLQLHHDTRYRDRVGRFQDDLAIDNVEVGIVRMRLVEADGHNHGGLLLNRPTALGGGSSNVCLDRVSDICILCAARSFVDTLQVFVCLADAGAQPAERVFDQINLTIFALRMTFVVAFAEVELRRGVLTLLPPPPFQLFSLCDFTPL
jgi:hypothetical protein